jgi:hypothetical protein
MRTVELKLARASLSLLLAISAPLRAQLLPHALIHATTIDSRGSIYVAGEVIAAGLPTSRGVLQPNPPVDCGPNSAGPTTCRHGFVAKLTSSGDRIVWATYLGGEGADSVTNLAVDASGNILLAGSTTSKTLLRAGLGYQSTPADIFVAKLSPDGGAMLAGTYFGGASGDSVAALKLDSSGNVYLAGTAGSAAFPTTEGAFQGQHLSEGSVCSGADEFVAKFDPSLRKLLFSTLIGSTMQQTAYDLAIGPDGTIYIAGTRGTERGPCNAWAILTRLSADASAAVYSTAVMGSSPWGGYSLAVDSTGFAYIGSDSRRWSLAAPMAVIWKVDPAGTVVASQTLRGLVHSLAVDSVGEIGLAGSAWPLHLSTTAGAPGSCRPLSAPYSLVPYVARFNASTLKVSYAGYVPGATGPNSIWLLGPNEALVSDQYSAEGSFNLVPIAPPPPGTVTCIADAANYDPEYVAPGEIISIFGNQIGPSDPLLAQFDAKGTGRRPIASPA